MNIQHLLRLPPKRAWALVCVIIALILILRLIVLRSQPVVEVAPLPTMSGQPPVVQTRVPETAAANSATAAPRPNLTRVPRSLPEPSGQPVAGDPQPPTARPVTAVATVETAPLAEQPTAPPIAPRAEQPAAPTSNSPAADPATAATVNSPTPQVSLSPTPRPRMIDNQIDPAWWPCQPGQIKGLHKLRTYYMPDQQGYARAFASVECFDTEQAATDAGYQRGE